MIKKSSKQKKTEIRPKRKKAETLNVRQIKYKKYRMEGYSKYSAARLAGYSHSTATGAKHIEERIPGFDKALEMAGLTDSVLAIHAAEGLNAMRLQTCDIYVKKDKDGKIHLNKTSDFIEVPDWHVRHRYLETILRDRKLRREPDANDGKSQAPGSGLVLQIFNFGSNGKPKDDQVTSSRVFGVDQPLAV